MLNAPLRIMIVAAACVLGLIGLVVREGYERDRPPNEMSRGIDMRMQAVDPRALLSGHYVIVSLQDTITVPSDVQPCQAFAALEDRKSWVALAYTGPETRVPPPDHAPLPYSVVGTASTRDEALAIARRFRSDGLAARGTAVCSELAEHPPGTIRSATVQAQLLGVERFHAQQSEAERIDALMRAQSPTGEAAVYAIVNIGRDGRARLKGLNVNGEIIELNWL